MFKEYFITWLMPMLCLIYYHFMILDGAPTKRRPSIDFIFITKCLIIHTFTSWDVFFLKCPIYCAYMNFNIYIICECSTYVSTEIKLNTSWCNEGEFIHLDTCSCFCGNTHWVLYCLVPFLKTGKGIKKEGQCYVSFVFPKFQA